MAGRRAATLLATLLLFASACLTALGATELAIRFRLGAWPFEPEPVMQSHLGPGDEVLRWHFYPRGSASLVAAARGAPQCRVLFLGDSVTQGLDMDAIQAHLDRLLAGSGPSAGTLRFGNGGHTTFQEIEFLKLHGLDHEPAVVVLGFVLNDVYHPYLHRPTAAGLLDREPEVRLHRFDTSRFPGSVVARSYLAHEVWFAQQVVRTRLGLRRSLPFEREDDLYLAWKPYGWDDTDRLIGELATLLRDRGVGLLAVVFPVVYQVDDAWREIDEAYVLAPLARVDAILARHAVPRLDVTDLLRARGGPALFEDRIHFNASGNRILAGEIADFVAREARGNLEACNRGS